MAVYSLIVSRLSGSKRGFARDLFARSTKMTDRPIQEGSGTQIKSANSPAGYPAAGASPCWPQGENSDRNTEI